MAEMEGNKSSSSGDKGNPVFDHLGGGGRRHSEKGAELESVHVRDPLADAKQKETTPLLSKKDTKGKEKVTEYIYLLKIIEVIFNNIGGDFIFTGNICCKGSDDSVHQF